VEEVISAQKVADSNISVADPKDAGEIVRSGRLERFVVLATQVSKPSNCVAGIYILSNHDVALVDPEGVGLHCPDIWRIDL